MNKKKILTAFLFTLFLLPLTAFSGTLERYCFQDQFGNFYDVRGGKLGKKAYTLQVSNGVCPAQPLTGIANFTQVTGGFLLTMEISRDPNGACQSYVITTTIDANLFGPANGTYDNLPRNAPADGAFVATRVVCPISLSPVKPNGRPGPGPAAGKASE